MLAGLKNLSRCHGVCPPLPTDHVDWGDAGTKDSSDRVGPGGGKPVKTQSFNPLHAHNYCHMGFRYDINRYPPKMMVTIPLIVLLLALISLGVNMGMTGMPVTPGMDFAGGTAVTVFTTDSEDQLAAVFSGYPLIDVETGINNGKYLKFGPMADEQFRALSALINQKYPDAKIDQIGASFGATLQQQAVIALVFSFILMAVVVFLVFRTLVPSLAVIISAFSDIVIAATLMNIFSIPLSLGTTAALLMLIGYSVDSDILLTNRVYVGKIEFGGEVYEGEHEAIVDPEVEAWEHERVQQKLAAKLSHAGYESIPGIRDTTLQRWLNELEMMLGGIVVHAMGVRPKERPYPMRQQEMQA